MNSSWGKREKYVRKRCDFFLIWEKAGKETADAGGCNCYLRLPHHRVPNLT